MANLNRPLGSMFQPNIDNALRLHAKLALRSERHGHYSDLFVDVDQLQALDTPDWQVVYGRRGTGKTLLLGMLDERSASTPEPRHLSVLITAPDCKVSPVGRTVPDKVRALGYFQTFLELLIDQVTEQLDHLLKEPGFLGRLTGQRRRSSDRAFELMVELLELASRGIPVGAFSDASDVREQTVSLETGQSTGLSASADVSARAKAGISAKVEASSDRRESETQQARTSSNPVPRFALVRRRLLELLEVLEIERLNILIDEWSMLDPTGATGIQPEFAEYLKRTFHGAAVVSVKIATNRYQTRFSNRGAGGSYRGLEMEADLFTGTNLDRAVLDRERLVTFYESLLFNRLALVDTGLKRFKPRGAAAPDDTFILSIFHDKRAFDELVKGAEGIPRDFLSLFNSVAKSYGHTVETRWTATQVKDVIRQRSITGQDAIEYRSVTSQLVDPCIRTVVAHTRSRIFFVGREHHPSVQDPLDELLEKRLIHDHPRDEIPAFARESSHAYLIDYGLWLDWERTRAADGPPGPENPLPDLSEDLPNWQIDPTQIEREDRVTCPHCGRVFTTDEPSYDRKGLCPECFEPIDDVVPDPA